MGAFISDPLGYLIKNYGEDVAKFIVADKAIEYLDDQTPKFKERVQGQLKNTSQSFDQQFDEKDKEIKTNFDNVIGDIKKSSPQALDKAKTSSGKSEEQLMGFNGIKQKMDQLKSQKDGKVKEQEQRLLKMVDDQKETMQKDIKDNKPKLPLFENMPLCLKQKVLSDGEAKFAPQIKEKQDSITKVFEQITNMDNLENNLKKSVGLDQAELISKDSKSTFKKAKKAISLSGGSTAVAAKGCFGGKKA